MGMGIKKGLQKLPLNLDFFFSSSEMFMWSTLYWEKVSKFK